MKKYFILIIFVGIFFFASDSHAATVTFATNGTTTKNTFDTARTSNTFTHTVPAVGADENRALVCLLVNQHAAATTGVTWNGTAMVEIKSFSAVRRFGYKAYYLAAPEVGTNLNIVSSYNESRSQGETWCFTLKDVVQDSGTVLDASGQADSASAASLSKAITTTLDGAMVLTTIIVEIGTPVNAVPDVGQTTMGQADNTELDDSSSITQTTAGSITTGYTWTNAGGTDIYVISLKYQAPAGGGGGAAALNRRIWWE